MVVGLDATGLSYLLSALSGGGLGLVGILLLVGQGRERRPYSTAIALFLLLWGVTVIAANAGTLATQRGDLDLGRTLLLVYAGVRVVAYLPLLYFAFSYPAPRGPLRWGIPGAALLLTPAALGALAMNVDPRLFHREFTGPPFFESVWGPLAWVYFALFMLSFFAVLIVLTTSATQSREGVGRRRLVFATLALALFPADWAPQQAIHGVVETLKSQSLGVGGFTTLALAAAGLATLLFVARRLMALAPTRRARLLILLAMGLPLLTGVASGISLLTQTPITFIGPWRLLSAGLIAYSVLRYERFDVDARLKRAALWSSVILGAILGAFALEQVFETLFGSTGIAITATQLVIVGIVILVFVRSRATTRWLARRILPDVESERRLDARRLEVYAAAVAQAQAEGGLGSVVERLASLRTELGISIKEHELFARLAEATGARSDVAGPLACGARVAGRYLLEQPLGEGAQGTAYLARDETLSRQVVVKLLTGRRLRDADAAHGFLEEARLAARIEHANVTRVYDFGNHGDVPFLVLEHTEGGSLQAAIERGEGFTEAQAARILDGVLAGLQAIHDAGVLHRDLKPANILLTRAGEPKITDFGVATPLDARMTRTGLALTQPAGTLAYASPEAIQGTSVDERTDVYAAGALLYQLATGNTYIDFGNASEMTVRQMILTQPPRAPLDATGSKLRAMWERALAKNADDRFASPDEMRSALRDAL